MVSCEMLQYPYRSQNSSILKIINSPGVILDLWSWPCSLSIRMWCWRFCKELRCLLQVNTGMPPASPGPWHREFRPVQRSREKTSSEPECSPLKPSRSVHLVLHSTHSGQAWTCWRTRQHDLFKKKKQTFGLFLQTGRTLLLRGAWQKSCNTTKKTALLSFIGFEWHTVWGPDRGFLCNDANIKRASLLNTNKWNKQVQPKFFWLAWQQI